MCVCIYVCVFLFRYLCDAKPGQMRSAWSHYITKPNWFIVTIIPYSLLLFLARHFR